MTDDDYDDDGELIPARRRKGEGGKLASEGGFSSGRRLTGVEWAEIVSYWEMGTKTLEELAVQYGKHPGSLQARLKGAGIVKGSRAVEAGDIVRAKVLGRAEIDAKRVVETKEQHYAYSEALAKLTMKIVIEAQSAPGGLAAVEDRLKTLERAAKIVSVTRAERWRILGLEKIMEQPGEIPELYVSEMTQADIDKARRQFDNEDLDDVVSLGETAKK